MIIFSTFAVAMKMQRRLRAAAQRRPSELAPPRSPCTAIVLVNPERQAGGDDPM